MSKLTLSYQGTEIPVRMPQTYPYFQASPAEQDAFDRFCATCRRVTAGLAALPAGTVVEDSNGCFYLARINGAAVFVRAGGVDEYGVAHDVTFGQDMDGLGVSDIELTGQHLMQDFNDKARWKRVNFETLSSTTEAGFPRLAQPLGDGDEFNELEWLIDLTSSLTVKVGGDEGEDYDDELVTDITEGHYPMLESDMDRGAELYWRGSVRCKDQHGRVIDISTDMDGETLVVDAVVDENPPQFADHDLTGLPDSATPPAVVVPVRLTQLADDGSVADTDIMDLTQDQVFDIVDSAASLALMIQAGEIELRSPDDAGGAVVERFMESLMNADVIGSR